MDKSEPGTNNRIGSLDLLRLLAALAVVAFHYLWRGHAGPSPFLDGEASAAASWALPGYLGLNLFFMISGFVIAWSAEGRSFSEFAIARFSRLYPGFIICMTLTAVILAIAGDPRLSVSGVQWLANFIMVPQALGQSFVDGVYWTIILELVFYGWVALAILTGFFARWKLMTITAWLGLAMVNEQLIGSGALRFLLITEYAPFFAFGMLVQHMTVHGRSADAVMLAVASLFIGLDHLSRMQGWMLGAYGVALPDKALVLWGLAIHTLFLATVALRRLVPSTPLVLAAGGVTYPLYLLHQNAGYAGINALSPLTGQVMAVAVVAIGMIVLSWLVWTLAERPGQKLMRRTLNSVVSHVIRIAGQSGSVAPRLRRFRKPI